MNDLISVIVPVYNVEKYLSECIDSILAQTYANFELILVDDGSKDKSGEICDDYAARDKRIRVFHKQNSGAASARNVGLDGMKGSYFVFIDSDDIIDEEYLETMINQIGDVDIIAVDIFRFDSNGKLLSNATNSFTIVGNENIRNAYANMEIGNFYSPCAKLYRNKENKTPRFFEKLVMGEDRFFNLCYLRIASGIKHIPYSGYGYRNNTMSVSHWVEKKYTPIYEHDYRLMENSIYDAEREWGITEDIIYRHYAMECPARFFRDVQNLFANGTPYNNRLKLEKIKHIFNDKEFICAIKEIEFAKLGFMGRIAKVCVVTKSNFVTFAIFILLKRIRRMMKV